MGLLATKDAVPAVAEHDHGQSVTRVTRTTMKVQGIATMSRSDSAVGEEQACWEIPPHGGPRGVTLVFDIAG